jgi:AcrR family transcriptional regulator
MNVHLYLQPEMRTRDDSKEKAIRQQALKMIVKDGFEGFSMQKLAKAAKVSPGTLYIYFQDKEDLILQLCREVGNKMSEATLIDFDPAMPFSEGLKVQWINRAKYCIKNPLESAFLEQLKHSSLQLKAIGILSQGFKEVMGLFVTNAIKRNELVKVPIEVYWSVAFAPLYNLVKFHQNKSSVGGRQFEFSDKIMMETLSLVLKALKP